MKIKINKIAVVVSFMAASLAHSQGFINLNFESAAVSGYAPGVASVPIAYALPGWSACFFTSGTTDTLSQVSYDEASAGGAMIAIVDGENLGFHFLPLAGNYGVNLFGGGSSVFYSAQISQTGLVPAGTKSIIVDAQNYDFPFILTLGGLTINMTPLDVFSNYTVYGGDISAFGGQVQTLSFTVPPAVGAQPSFLALDDIQFSQSPVPEPGVFGLGAMSGMIFLIHYRRKNVP